MPINPLVLELLEKASESGLSAEEVCRDRPELLGEVRACLRQLSSVRDELDALFPEIDEAARSPVSPASQAGNPRLPRERHPGAGRHGPGLSGPAPPAQPSGRRSR